MQLKVLDSGLNLIQFKLNENLVCDICCVSNKHYITTLFSNIIYDKYATS